MGPLALKFTYPRQRFPGFLGISCGDLARRLTFCDKSPFLNSVAKQLKDRRRRKKAFGRVTEIVIKVVARAVSSGAFWGIIVDGLRDHELPDFEAALGSRYTVLAHLSCPSDVMLSRLSSRQDREGDDRLGLVETDAAGRVQAYLERAPEETKNLRAYAEATSSRAFFDLDATLQVPSLVEDMVARLNAFAKSSGFSLDAQTAQTDTASVDWELHISEVASRLDREFHPDGKPRSKHHAAGCEKDRPKASLAELSLVPVSFVLRQCAADILAQYVAGTTGKVGHRGLQAACSRREKAGSQGGFVL